MKNNGILLLVLLLIVSCTPQHHHHSLRISTNNWIGYTPLFYAKEKGSLDLINIKLTSVRSLSENMHLYKAGNTDAFCATQYEYFKLNSQFPTLVPIMLFDRSYGGDMIMSNHSINELQNSAEQIHAYLQIDSINMMILNDFMKKYKIDESRINYKNRDQDDISFLTNSTPNVQVLIVTYIPVDKQLKENGFTEILSTKDGLDLLVVDALFTRRETFKEHEEQFVALKKLVDKAIESLHDNPREFYETIQAYFPELTYVEFIMELHDIEWINKDLDPALESRLHKLSFSSKDLI